MAGDQAGFCEWQLFRRDKRGHPIYLRKFFHDGFNSGSNKDQISTETHTAYVAFASKLWDSTFPEGRVIQSHLGPEQVEVSSASIDVTTRTLKHRGKRGGPKPAPSRA
jgi:hypothetical protein